MKNVENPFFSVIIPCYNSKNTIARLLKSIVDQRMADEIEVILSDDHSTESYESEVEPFYDKLCIRKITTDYNCCPGNTREKGVSIARGKWIVFADHDDIFLPNVFREIKTQIVKQKENYMVYCNIYRSENTDGKFNKNLRHREMNKFNTLLHGKFFNKENFWDKFDIHFKKDMFTHEDTYVVNVSKCILNHLGVDALHLDFPVYVWFNNSSSLSNSTGLRNFLEEHFHYYVEGSAGVFKEYYKKGIVSKEFGEQQSIRILLYEYFYMQMFMFTNPEKYLRSNILVCVKDFEETKEMFNLTNMDVYSYAASGKAALYTSVATEAGYGFIPQHSLMQWFGILDMNAQ